MTYLIFYYKDCEDEDPLGFVLYYKDIENSDFSNLPGYGTVLEIGLKTVYREKGKGKELVRYAETQMQSMGLHSFYVCAYGPAEGF